MLGHLLCGLALVAHPWRPWPPAECYVGWYCHSRLRLERLGLALSVFRIPLSVLLFAGAFTNWLDGRLGSVRILAQNERADKVLIKRFPSLTVPRQEKDLASSKNPVSRKGTRVSLTRKDGIVSQVSIVLKRLHA
jgi:hypothetical protein